MHILQHYIQNQTSAAKLCFSQGLVQYLLGRIIYVCLTWHWELTIDFVLCQQSNSIKSNCRHTMSSLCTTLCSLWSWSQRTPLLNSSWDISFWSCDDHSKMQYILCVYVEFTCGYATKCLVMCCIWFHYTFWRPQALLPMQRSQWLCRNAWAGNETHAGYTYIQLTACCSACGECRCHSFGRLVLELCLYTWSMVLPARTSDCFTTAIITASIHTNVYNKRCVQCCSPFGLKAWRPIHTKETLNPYLSIWLSSQLQTALHIMSEYSVEISSHTLYIW